MSRRKYKYRFKTKDELINEFSSGWSRICAMDSSGLMEHLLGTSVNVPDNALDDNGDVFQYFYLKRLNEEYMWVIKPCLIKKIPNVPTYNRKKLVYE